MIKHLLPFLLIAATACVQAQETPAKPDEAPLVLPETVATVDGKPITRAELQKNFEAVLASSGRTADSLSRDQKLVGYHRILSDMITDKLLSEKTKDLPVDDAAYKEAYAQVLERAGSEANLASELKKAGETPESLKAALRSGLQKRGWIDSQTKSAAPATDAEARKFYDENSASFKRPEQVRASHILIMVPQDADEKAVEEKRKAIEKVAARIKKGEDFAKVANETTEDPGGKGKGGDLDYFTKEQMVPEFAEMAFSLKPGEVSAPVKTQFGFHLIKVADKRPAGTVGFDEEKERIIQFLGNRKRMGSANEVITKLRGDAKISINLPPMPQPPATTGPSVTTPPVSAPPKAE